jgi:hypothetical protein
MFPKYKNIILLLHTTKASVHSLAKRQLEPYATLLHILIIYEHQLTSNDNNGKRDAVCQKWAIPFNHLH